MYQYPDTHGPEGTMLDAGPVPEVARIAEASGFEGFALTEHPAPPAAWLAAGGHQTIDPFVALGSAAAVTSTMKLLTYLTVVPYRNPMLLAKAAATVDLMSDGRFILGVGTGYSKGEFHALGVDFDERNALFDEALDVLPLHWSGEPFSYEGLHFNAREVIARPAPIQSPIPIWIGGNSKLTKRRVASRAQGWMPLIGDPAMFPSVRTPVIAPGDDLTGEIASLNEAAGERVPLDYVVSYDVMGDARPAEDADRHRDAFSSFEKSGVTWVVVQGSTHSLEDTRSWLEEFSATYF